VVVARACYSRAGMSEDSTVPTSDPPAAVPSSLLLVLSSAQADAIRTASLPARGLVSIGRSSECTIVVEDASLSRRHATLRLPELTIVDHGSRNGTWLGATRMDGETAVPIGRPFRLGEVSAVVVRVGALDPRALRERDDELARACAGASPIAATYALATKIAPSAVSVLIQGETGVGKEVLAELIHRRSPRAERPLIKVNCAAFAPTLFESQMFGHERGAFTGAVDTQVGMIEAADGGTLFLDEVADLPLELQAKLLRVLEDRVVVRVGAVQGRRVDVRFITASNEQLASRVDAGRFRADLFFRLAGVTLRVPPLRERRDEIEPLAELFALRAAVPARAEPPALGAAARAALRAHAWPGNIRQLRNIVERAVLLCEGPTILPEHLDLDEPPRAAAAEVAIPDAALDADEPEHLLAALARCAGNQTRAARLLGISRNTLLARLDRFGLPRPRK
jgi:two-component system, NtrC family, response regulator AtoC